MMLLVLLPGMNGTADLFAPLLAVLPDNVDHRVITYPTDTFLNCDELVRLIEDQLRDVDDLVLVGESYSGALALGYAAVHPEKIRAVILSAGFVRPPWPSWIRFLIRPFWIRLTLPKFVIRYFVAGSDASDALVELISNAWHQPAAEVFAQRAREALTMDWTDRLARCPSPIVYIKPLQDRMVGESSLRQMLAVRPDVAVKELTGPHLIFQAKPQEAWHAIQKIISQTTKQPVAV